MLKYYKYPDRLSKATSWQGIVFVKKRLWHTFLNCFFTTFFPQQQGVWAGLESPQGCSAACDTGKINSYPTQSPGSVFSLLQQCPTLIVAGHQHSPGLETHRLHSRSPRWLVMLHLQYQPRDISALILGLNPTLGLSHLGIYNAVPGLEVGGDTPRHGGTSFWSRCSVGTTCWFYLQNTHGRALCALHVWNRCWSTAWSHCLSPGPASRTGCGDISMLSKLDPTSWDPDCFQESAVSRPLPSISWAHTTGGVSSYRSLQDLVLTAVYPRHVYSFIFSVALKVSSPYSLYLWLAHRSDCWVYHRISASTVRCRQLHSSHCFIAKSLIHYTLKRQTRFWKPYSQSWGFTHRNKLPYAMGVLLCPLNE